MNHTLPKHFLQEFESQTSEQEGLGNLLNEQFYIWDILLLLKWVQNLKRCDCVMIKTQEINQKLVTSYSGVIRLTE